MPISEFSARIEYERGELHPLESHLNMQMEFKRSHTATNNALVAISVLMLPFEEFVSAFFSRLVAM